jgi:ADP-ribose pyrophosphatase YjhB (NUDIX family)
MLANQESTAVWCYDASGNAVAVAPERLAYRPATYGLFLEHGEIWLLRHPYTQLFYPPGVILAEHQTPRQALLACLRRMTGLTLATGPLIFLEEQYRIDETGQPWHLSAMYYAVLRPSLAATMPVEANESLEKSWASWVPLNELTREQMQFGYQAIQAARRAIP